VTAPLRLLDLFSGIGCFSLGLERSGAARTVAFCEKADYPRRVLRKHWPEVPIYDDVSTLTADRLAADGIIVDAICGGFPCQNVSIAAAVHGGHHALDGEQSGLWFEYARLIKEIRPRAVIIENVKDLLRCGLDGVLRSLAALGYDAEWQVLPGPIVGAPQPRERVWIIAYPAGQRVEGLCESLDFSAARQGWAGREADLLDVAHSAFGGDDRFPQPLLRGMDDRPADWAHRLRACGNAVIPQIPEQIGRAILVPVVPSTGGENG
jgi:DNA (cytosine-5)-methyltransferase 1